MNTENLTETTVTDTTTTPDSTEKIVTPEAPVQKKRRGFAAMDPTKVASIASKGGKAAHAAGTAHRFSKEEAAAAGKKGGLAPRAKRRSNGIHGSAPAESTAVDNQPNA